MKDHLQPLRESLADRYAVERALGAGGMGVVYLARDLRHGRNVAIKVLGSEGAARWDGTRFLREIEITAGLTHPHILPVYDSGRGEDYLYYVTPFIEGGSLRDLIRQQPIPLEVALQLTREIAGALDYAHRQDVIHRDIKPENILILDGQAMVGDFGVARAISAAGVTFTESGVAVGSPPYMSPEQAIGARGLDGRTDIYSLGCVLYEMLFGKPPEAAFNQAEIRHLESGRFSLRHRRDQLDQIPPNVLRVLARALAQRPSDRYATAREFADALPCRAHPAGRRRARHLIGLAAAALVVLLGGFAVGTPGQAEVLRRGVPKIAVLPFENLGSANEEAFVEGATDETTARLAKVGGVVVLARQSTTRYRRSPKTVRQIGSELDADFLLEATVSWQAPGGRDRSLRVRPQLIRVDDGTHIWADAFTVSASDVLAAQASVAESVAVHIERAFRTLPDDVTP